VIQPQKIIAILNPTNHKNYIKEENLMFDFQNAGFFKLKRVDDKAYEPLMVSGETICATYQAIRDGIVFTNKRILAINVQGITGVKKDITSLPYSKIQSYSVETAGVLDLDSELELWFSGLGKVKFEFKSNCNVSQICNYISNYVL